MNTYVVAMQDLESEEAVSQALDLLVAAFDNVDNLTQDWQLVLAFRDPEGRELDEEAFFKRAIEIPRGPGRIETVLRKFMASHRYEYVYHHEEMTALAHALTALVLHAEHFVDLYTEYFLEMDHEHDVYHQEFLMLEVLRRWDWSPRLLRLLAATEIMSRGGTFEEFGEEGGLLGCLEDDIHLQILIDALREYSSNGIAERMEAWAESPNPIKNLVARRFDELAARSDRNRAKVQAQLQKAAQTGTGGDWKTAAEILTDTASIDPYNIEVLNLYAYALLATGDPKAEKTLERVLEIDPGNVHALSNLALLHYRCGDIDKGNEAYSRLFAAAPPLETLYHCYMSDLYSAEFEARDAARAYFLERATALDPEFEEHAVQFVRIANSRIMIQNAVNSGKEAQVEELAEKYVELVGEYYSDRPLEMSEALYLLGKVYEGVGRFTAAINAYNKGRKLDQEDRENINWAGSALKNDGVAECYRKSGDLSQPGDYYRFAMENGETAWGEGHPNLAVFYGHKGLWELQQWFLPQAEEMFAKALAICEAGLPETHPFMAVCLANMGQLRLDQERPGEALEFLGRACDICKRLYGMGHRETALALLKYAVAEQELDRTVQAMKTAREAHAILASVLWEEHVDTASANRVLGRILMRNGKLEEAVERLQNAAAAIASFYGDENPATAEALADLGEALLKTGNAVKASELLDESYRIFRSTTGMQHPAVFTIQRNLARARLVNEDIAGSAEVFAELARTALQHKAFQLAYDTYGTIVLIYLGAGLSREAQTFLDRANKARADIPGQPVPLDEGAFVQETVADLLAAGKEEEAFAFNSMVLALAEAQEKGDLPAISDKYRERIDPDHIEYALRDEEVFAAPVFTPDWIYVFTVTSAKGLKVLKELGGSDFDLASFIKRKRPGMTLVTVSDMLGRTTEAVRQEHEEACREHEKKAATYEEACARIQQEMQEQVNRAIAEGRYEDVTRITEEMTSRIAKLGKDYGFE